MVDSVALNGNAVSPSDGETHTCQVCYDLSDGLHFGIFSCRACAAFFRRTVSLRLEYVCRAEGKCSIHKSARNMCRACRFQKCITHGMQITAVQQSRDGIGKRKESKDRRDTGYKMSIAGSLTPPHAPSTTFWNDTSPTEGGQLSVIKTSLSEAPMDQRPSPSSSDGSFYYNPEIFSHTAPVATSFSTMVINQSPSYTYSPKVGTMKILPKMHEGYLHFLSIRKATNSLVENESIQQMFQKKESLRMSNFESSKKVCQMEAHLVTNVVNNYFHPFSKLDFNDKVALFKNFFCYLSNSDRAFQSYKLFGDENDDRILMPDGGYIKLSELEKFYENAESVKASPEEAAKLFRPAMSYIINVIIAHMRRIQITEYEYIAILGLFLWSEGVQGISGETMKVIHETQEQIFQDLHTYYQQMGCDGSLITSKTAQLMLLVPKLTRSVVMLRDNFDLAELFQIFEVDVCCKSFKNTDYS